MFFFRFIVVGDICIKRDRYDQNCGLFLVSFLTDPASSTRNSRKGLKDNNTRLLSIVNKFPIPFGTERTISICGGLKSDCIVVTLQRVGNFRFKIFISDTERTRRGVILLVKIFRFLVKRP